MAILAALVLTALMLWFLDKYSPYSARNNKAAHPYPCRYLIPFVFSPYIYIYKLKHRVSQVLNFFQGIYTEGKFLVCTDFIYASRYCNEI